MRPTSLNCEQGLFTCYDVPGLPRTSNDRQSEFRDLTRRLLAENHWAERIGPTSAPTTGTWEMIPRPDSLSVIIVALQQVPRDAFSQERQRVCEHRSRFRMHTRSAKQSGKQLKQLTQLWAALPPHHSS